MGNQALAKRRQTVLGKPVCSPKAPSVSEKDDLYCDQLDACRKECAACPSKCPTECQKECPKSWHANIPSSKDIPNHLRANPVNQSILNSGYLGKKCGNVCGLNEECLTQCGKMVQLQQEMNSIYQKDGTTGNLYWKIKYLPDKVAHQDKLPQVGQAMKDGVNKAYNEQYGKIWGDEKQEGTLPGRVALINRALQDRVHQNQKKIVALQNTTLDRLRAVGSIQNETGGNLLDKLRQIETQVSVKNRLIQINNNSAKKKQRTIHYLMGSFIFLAIIVLLTVFYMAGKMTLKQFLLSIALSLTLFIIFLFVIGERGGKLDKLQGEIKKSRANLVNKGDQLNLAAVQWVDDNCDCPDSYKKSIQDNKTKTLQSEALRKVVAEIEPDEDGIYYNDGTGPTEVIKAGTFAQVTGKLPSQLHDGDNPMESNE